MKKSFLIICMLFCFSACGKIDLYHDLSEEDANDIMVVLQQEGISISKVKEVRQNEVFWTVRVDPKRLGDARRLLVEHNLPHKRELGLTGVYKEKGLIPTPDEQKARFLLAVKGEIINSLLKIPGVIDVDVVLNLPTPDEFAAPGAKEKRPTASVIIKAQSSYGEVISESKIQQFVANAVENLNPRDISVIITYLSSTKQGLLPGQSLILPSASDTSSAAKGPLAQIAGVEVTLASQGRLKLYLALFFGLLSILAAVLVVTIIKSSRMRQELLNYKDGESKALAEGQVVEDRPKLGGRK